MATLDQLMGGDQTGDTQPLRPTTLGNQHTNSWNQYLFAQYRLKEQKNFINEVGLNEHPRVSGAPAVYDFAERDKEYALKKLQWQEEAMRSRYTHGYPLGE